VTSAANDLGLTAEQVGPTCLVTGGRGYLGRHLVARLARWLPDDDTHDASFSLCAGDWSGPRFLRAELIAALRRTALRRQSTVMVTDLPASGGSCHSDATYMRRFGPSISVDQEAEYRTSHHGRSLSDGDTNVATCVSCHGTHGIRRPADPLSRFYPDDERVQHRYLVTATEVHHRNARKIVEEVKRHARGD